MIWIPPILCFLALLIGLAAFLWVRKPANSTSTAPALRTAPTTHTPGPYEIITPQEEDGTGAGFYLIRGQGRTIATIYPFDKPEDAANALLFAAAPELIAALKNAADPGGTWDWQMIAAAIAKAEGRS